MLAKFIFLTFFSVSVGRFVFLREEPIQAKTIECSDSARSNLKPSKALNFDATKSKKRWIDSLKIKAKIDRMFSLSHPFSKQAKRFMDHLSRSPDVVHLAPKKRLDLKEKFSKNQHELTSLKKDSNELATLKLEISNELLQLSLREKNQPTATTLIFWHAFNALKELIDSLVIFKQRRFLELGNIDTPTSNANLINLLVPKVTKGFKRQKDFSKLPDDIIQIITTKSWINYGNSIVKKLKVINKNLLFDQSLVDEWSTFDLWWECVLGTIDFLFKNLFTDPSVVKNFFQDPHVIRQITHYVNFRYDLEIEESIVMRTTYPTEHWYWSLLHESFKGISKKQEVLFNYHAMLEIRYLESYNLCRINSRNFPSRAWIDFFESFESKEYCMQLMKLDESGVPPRSDDNFLAKKAERMIIRDVKTIFFLIATSNAELANVPHPSRNILILYLCEVLDFIQRFISPGIIDRISHHNPNFLEFDKRFNTLLLSSKMNDIYWKATDYYQYITKNYPSNWSTTVLYHSKFDDYLHQFNQEFKQMQQEGLRLKSKLGNEIYYTEMHEPLVDVHNSFQKLALELKIKSDTFA